MSVDICNDFLIEYLNYDTLPLIMQIALWHENNKLLNICERMVCDHANEVFENEAFQYNGQQVLKQILSMPSLSCSESDLLDACMKWAESACQQNDIPNPELTLIFMTNKYQSYRLILFVLLLYFEFVKCQMNEKWRTPF